MVFKVTEPDTLIEETMAYAESLAAQPIDSLVATKRLMLAGGRTEAVMAAQRCSACGVWTRCATVGRRMQARATARRCATVALTSRVLF